MLPKYVRVKNKSDIRRTIEDRDLPGGFIRIEPDEETSIPITTYIRTRRRCGRWIVNVDSATYKSETPPMGSTSYSPQEAIVCEVCGQVAKSAAGRASHMRKHRIQEAHQSSPQEETK